MDEKLLSLSTVHMPSSTPDWCKVRAHQYEEGFIVWVVERDDNYPAQFVRMFRDYVEQAIVPEWLSKIMEDAYREGYTLIKFDCDDPVRSRYKKYDWESSSPSPATSPHTDYIRCVDEHEYVCSVPAQETIKLRIGQNSLSIMHNADGLRVEAYRASNTKPYETLRVPGRVTEDQ